MIKFKSLASLVLCSLVFGEAFASSYRPLPDALLRDRPPPLPPEEKARLTTAVGEVIDHFAPMAAAQGAQIKAVFNWESSGSGAFTFRKDGGRTWEIHFYDGILRFPFATHDLLMSLVCHELGHPLGGYPFKDNRWSSAEGQADYFSLHTCLPEVWQHQPEDNARIGQGAPVELRRRCEGIFPKGPRLDICLRSAVLMESIRQYERDGRPPFPRFDTPDRRIVAETETIHPEPQCRLDTQIAAMLCSRIPDPFQIPGHLNRGENTQEAEEASARQLCVRERGETAGARPQCWFASLAD